MKDIFIDVQIANRFSRPPNDEYKNLIRWLLECEDAYLVVSDKLKNKYWSGGQCLSSSPTSICHIYDILESEHRLNIKSSKEIKLFQEKYYKDKSINLKCNKEDKDHLPIIILSNRQYAIIEDNAFAKVVSQFPKFKGRVSVQPGTYDYT
jgi:hypothetical protein